MICYSGHRKPTPEARGALMVASAVGRSVQVRVRPRLPEARPPGGPKGWSIGKWKRELGHLPFLSQVNRFPSCLLLLHQLPTSQKATCLCPDASLTFTRESLDFCSLPVSQYRLGSTLKDLVLEEAAQLGIFKSDPGDSCPHSHSYPLGGEESVAGPSALCRVSKPTRPCPESCSPSLLACRPKVKGTS